jgi:menaquinol-cytochrome c reductase iron-sulfur subunit
MRDPREESEEPHGAASLGSSPQDTEGPESPRTTPEPRRDGCGREPETGRRRFLGGLASGIGTLAGIALIVPWIRLFMTPTARTDPQVWRSIGSLQDFPVGDPVRVTYLDPAPLPWAGFAARNAAWVRRDSEQEFTAFTAYCTHVGCPVRWDEGAHLFLCPCHGGAFHANGTVAAGPPPRPLDRYPIRVRDGLVELRTVGVPDPSS